MANNPDHSDNYWHAIFKQFHKNILGRCAFYLLIAFCIVGIYAPFLASSRPFVIEYDGEWYFPFFRYIFFLGFYTKRLDIFFNLLMFTLPVGFIIFKLFRKNPPLKLSLLGLLLFLQIFLFFYFSFWGISDPASSQKLSLEKQVQLKSKMKEKEADALFPPQPSQDWFFELNYMNSYAKLNQVLRYQQRKKQHKEITEYVKPQIKQGNLKSLSTLWQMEKNRVHEQIDTLRNQLNSEKESYISAFNTLALYLEACRSINAVSKFKKDCHIIKEAEVEEQPELKQAKQAIAAYWSYQESLRYYKQRKAWLKANVKKISFQLMPLLRPFHWQEDAGGNQALNRYLPWWERTRINRKDLLAALIFGIRISLVVGFLAVSLAVIIGVPIGAFAGFYGGTFDIIVSRLLEIWESMPTFFMLLLVIAITQSKTIFIVIAVIGLFGWPSFSRYTRGEFFKQRNLSYVEALRCIGFSNLSIMFKDILPNAIPPLLTLLPFAIMGAITSEAGLSFLGLGEEGSCSWGVLMDEGRTAFPAEAYLLWPPAILLTILLVAIALVGDALRDALDPRLKR